ncbi:membrane dipeptidase [Novosphingobium chloroacetimidivorans]|uniref:Membrane dipeptidase n=1 Tax=Novosphingobium chloroacetimidivorans TaxID=1428314 RepID=A0A7W7K7W1_9SPHN|nr:dipeptidase [Novosphingobium chloroacetimidivorans]MBB4857506.1 membrane dipeptidase [Novosphingobium chloroacetimidivorans]
MRTALLALALAAPAGSAIAASPEQTAQAALRAAPVWDGHNDVPEQLRERRKDVLEGFDFRDTTATADPATDQKAMHTDLVRLRQGRVGAQFWSVYVSADLPEAQAVQATLEQIDVTKRLVARYPAEMQLCTSAAQVEQAMKAGKVASLIGMEGGHSIGGSLAVLRQMHALGARYMTLTHFNTLAWADAATDAPRHGGLTDFGRDVVREMQRIGMLVDLSHVSADTMRDALEVARAPVIFSHSGARAVNAHPRNVPDDVLALLKANGGIVMIDFAPDYVSEEVRAWSAAKKAEAARNAALWIGNPDGLKKADADWLAAHPAPRATLVQVADHIDHAVKLAGIDHVGLGGDFDGVGSLPTGLEDVSTYPALFTELARRGYTRADLEKIASRNMLRVMKAAEAYAATRRSDPPVESATTF